MNKYDTFEEVKYKINSMSLNNIDLFSLKDVTVDQHPPRGDYRVVIDYNDDKERKTYEKTIEVIVNDDNIRSINEFLNKKNDEIRKLKKWNNFWEFISKNFLINKYFWVIIIIILSGFFGINIVMGV